MIKRLILLCLVSFYFSGCSVTNKQNIPLNFPINEVKGDIFKIHLSDVRMERHPTKKGYINIILQVMNRDKVSQTYPPLQVLFTDKLGKVVEKRMFPGDKFLSQKKPKKLKPLESRSIIMTFNKMPKGAVSFTVVVDQEKI